MTPLPPCSVSRHPGRRGTVLIVAMGVLAILTALVLTLARSMRVEAVTSANYAASVQADAVELAGEQYAAELLVNQADQVLTMDYTNFTAIPVGTGGYFWVIRPNYADPTLPSYGFIDENAKLNINTATEDMLLMLPGMTQDLADAIIDWRDDDEDPSASGAGAESQYYMTLPNPYQAKNAPFESVEELLLVRGFTRELLYGQSMADDNRFLPYDQADASPVGGLDITSDPSLYRGLFDFLTVYSVANNPADPAAPGGNNGGSQQPGGNASQGSRPQVAGGGNGGGSGNGSGNGNGGGTGSGGGGGGSGSTATASGRINVNTAPREVLRCLPGLDEADVDAILSQRASTLSSDPTDTTWLASTLGPKVNNVLNYVTGQSYQYSADIVAVSANGRSFKRVRVIFDTRSGTPKVIYRRDLTPFGWPLDPQILASLRDGAGIPGGGTTASGITGSSRRTM